MACLRGGVICLALPCLAGYTHPLSCSRLLVACAFFYLVSFLCLVFYNAHVTGRCTLQVVVLTDTLYEKIQNSSALDEMQILP